MIFHIKLSFRVKINNFRDILKKLIDQRQLTILM